MLTQTGYDDAVKQFGTSMCWSMKMSSRPLAGHLGLDQKNRSCRSGTVNSLSSSVHYPSTKYLFSYTQGKGNSLVKVSSLSKYQIPSGTFIFVRKHFYKYKWSITANDLGDYEFVLNLQANIKWGNYDNILSIVN